MKGFAVYKPPLLLIDTTCYVLTGKYMFLSAFPCPLFIKRNEENYYNEILSKDCVNNYLLSIHNNH